MHSAPVFKTPRNYHEIRSSVSCIQRRSGGYYFRQRVPTVLRPFFGKTEIVVTLRTRSRLVAERNASELKLTVRHIFEELMGSIGKISHSQAKQIAENWKRRTLNQDFEDRIAGIKKKSGHNYMPQISRRTWELNQAEYGGCQTWASEIMSGENLLHKPDTQDWKRMVHYLLRAEIERLAELQKREMGDTPYSMDFLESPTEEARTIEHTEDLRISVMLEKWEKTSDRSIRLLQLWRLSVKRYIELKGDMPVTAITSDDIADFKNAYAKMPKHLNGADKSLTMPQILKKYEGQDIQRLHYKTVNNSLTAVGAVLGWCVQERKIKTNPATGIKMPKTKVDANIRVPFSQDDLKRVFEKSPVYRENKRYKSGGLDACYWIPLLALYTGARLEELGCLYPHDVVTENGITYLDIYADQNKRVKTQSSIRKVPLHNDMLNSGFLQYVEHIKRHKHPWLFPHLNQFRDRRTHYFSKWFGKYLRNQCGVSDSRKVFHSFRHTFKDAGRNAGLDSKLNDAITGHEDNSVSGNYGYGHSLQAIKDNINKIEFNIEIIKPS